MKKKESKGDYMIKNYREFGYNVKDGNLIKPNGEKASILIDDKNRKIIAIKGFPIKLHRLIAYEKFGDELFKQPVVRHLDGNPLNNHPDNLELGSHSDNFQDMNKEDRKKKIIKAVNASISKTRSISFEKSLEIREYYKIEKNKKNISKKYNIPYYIISCLLTNKTYKSDIFVEKL